MVTKWHYVQKDDKLLEVHKDFVVRFAVLLEKSDLDNTIIDSSLRGL